MKQEVEEGLEANYQASQSSLEDNIDTIISLLYIE